jgi:hypothetical protein
MFEDFTDEMKEEFLSVQPGGRAKEDKCTQEFVQMVAY